MRTAIDWVEASQRSGEPPRSAVGDRGVTTGTRVDAVEGEIAGLDGLPIEDLQIAWQKLYRAEPPTRLSRDLLIRAIAYKLQEQAHGGLGPAIVRRLHALVVALGDGDLALMPVATLKLGTRLVREWHGRTHSVIVVEGGFDYDGERYRSLTEIARRITGSHRSGPVFFGLKRRPSPTPAKGRR